MQSGRIWERRLKRLLDVVGSGLGLIALSPLLAATAALIKLDSPGPVFFHQERVGYRGRRFRLHKFRTMVENAERIGLGVAVEQADPRITRVGAVLRRTSIDELPQLVNVLRGEMSLVGPRPTLPYQVARYTPEQRRRLLVKPGLTGWAQINGRNRLTWPQKIALDLWYVENWSLRLDLAILARTPFALLESETLYTPWVVDEISRPPEPARLAAVLASHPPVAR